MIVDKTNLSYRQLLKNVFLNGNYTTPRRQVAHELLGMSAIFSLKSPIIVSDARKLSYTFMAAEALWITSGDNSVAGIAPYCKKIRDFSDNGLTFNGAYGPRWIEQKDYIINTLKQDPESRQAVMTIFRERPTPSKDIPCTVSLQWVIRADTIHCIVNMRSSDLFLGLPYDIFNFSMMTMEIREALRDIPMWEDLMLGNLYYSAGSCHIYARDMPKIKDIIDEKPEAFFLNQELYLGDDSKETRESWLYIMRKTGEFNYE